MAVRGWEVGGHSKCNQQRGTEQVKKQAVILTGLEDKVWWKTEYAIV
jgi:hypothetical protein